MHRQFRPPAEQQAWNGSDDFRHEAVRRPDLVEQRRLVAAGDPGSIVAEEHEQGGEQVEVARTVQVPHRGPFELRRPPRVPGNGEHRHQALEVAWFVRGAVRHDSPVVEQVLPVIGGVEKNRFVEPHFRQELLEERVDVAGDRVSVRVLQPGPAGDRPFRPEVRAKARPLRRIRLVVRKVDAGLDEEDELRLRARDEGSDQVDRGEIPVPAGLAVLVHELVDALQLPERQTVAEIRTAGLSLDVDRAHPGPTRVVPHPGIGVGVLAQRRRHRSGAQDDVGRGTAVRRRDGVAEVDDAVPVPPQGRRGAALDVQIQIVAADTLVDHEHDVRRRRGRAVERQSNGLAPDRRRQTLVELHQGEQDRNGVGDRQPARSIPAAGDDQRRDRDERRGGDGDRSQETRPATPTRRLCVRRASGPARARRRHQKRHAAQQRQQNGHAGRTREKGERRSREQDLCAHDRRIVVVDGDSCDRFVDHSDQGPRQQRKREHHAHPERGKEPRGQSTGQADHPQQAEGQSPEVPVVVADQFLDPVTENPRIAGQKNEREDARHLDRGGRPPGIRTRHPQRP